MARRVLTLLLLYISLSMWIPFDTKAFHMDCPPLETRIARLLSRNTKNLGPVWDLHWQACIPIFSETVLAPRPQPIRSSQPIP